MSRRVLSRVLKGSKRFWAARSGNIALIAAVTVPVVALAAVGGIQIAYVVGVRSKTQDIADSTALMAAQQLGVESTGAQSRAQSWAKAQLASLSSSTTYAVQVSLLQNNQVQVTITTNTPSFFGPELPVGGFPTKVTATAQALGSSPLCVLVTAPQGGDQLHLTGQAQMNSTCLVYSDSNIQVDGGAALAAPQTEAVNTASGPITPAALTGASQVADPFASMNTNFPTPCAAKLPDTNITSNTTLPNTGVPVCSNINVSPNTTLTLGSGNWYFGYNITLQAGSVLQGSDVVLFFANNSVLNLPPNSQVILSGRQSGPYAGFVMITSRSQTANFNLSSDPLSKVTGTIYSPNAPLVIQGTAQAAQASDWTVIVARAITLNGSPQIQINSNYATSSVPTPSGVGVAETSGSRLTN